jgi:pimeloyl-ACP methyl ester carboxylesterase
VNVTVDAGGVHLDVEVVGRRTVPRSCCWPGSARSAPVPYTLADLAEDALAVLGHLGVEDVHGVGRSMGEMVA